jgi:hypothetical protein
VDFAVADSLAPIPRTNSLQQKLIFAKLLKLGFYYKITRHQFICVISLLALRFPQRLEAK